jgi:UDP-glucuronate 4-epimerase
VLQNPEGMLVQDTVLVTGAAGFIGFCLARRLLEGDRTVIGVDSVNSYYDPTLKEARLEILKRFPSFTFCRLDLANRDATRSLFHDFDFGPVVHLAAQAGVRYSLENPHAYLEANLAGFLNVLEGCRYRKTPHLIYASSSSVYGANTQLPFSVRDNVDHPISLYAATKKANELMAHSYCHLYGLPATGLRFFTVYGPWGRPDMAMYIFAKAITEAKPIRLFNYGRMRRDFTFVDDVIETVERLLGKPPVKISLAQGADPSPGESTVAPWRVYNIGNNTAVEISYIVGLLETELGRQAKVELVPMQPGDVPETVADVEALMQDVGFRPATPIEHGVHRFASWFRDYHQQ